GTFRHLECRRDERNADNEIITLEPPQRAIDRRRGAAPGALVVDGAVLRDLEGHILPAPRTHIVSLVVRYRLSARREHQQRREEDHERNLLSHSALPPTTLPQKKTTEDRFVSQTRTYRDVGWAKGRPAFARYASYGGFKVRRSAEREGGRPVPTTTFQQSRSQGGHAARSRAA